MCLLLLSCDVRRAICSVRSATFASRVIARLPRAVNRFPQPRASPHARDCSAASSATSVGTYLGDLTRSVVAVLVAHFDRLLGLLCRRNTRLAPHRGRRAWGGPHATRRHRRGCAGGGGGIRGHRVVEVGEVPWVLLVAASPVAADAQLRRWRHAGMSCGMYAHIPSRGPKHLLAPSQASQGMHMLRV